MPILATNIKNKKMDIQEVAVEMLRFLNETGNYQNFLSWAEARGFDPDQNVNKTLKMTRENISHFTVEQWNEMLRMLKEEYERKFINVSDWYNRECPEVPDYKIKEVVKNDRSWDNR